MKPEEMNEKFADLNAQVDEMNHRLEDAREERNELLRQRFDLKEQRRYFRAQLRDAKAEDNAQRISEVEGRLSELGEQLDELDEKIDALEEAIDETSDQIDDIMDGVDDLENVLDDAAEQARETEQPQAQDGASIDIDFNKAAEKLNGLLTKGFKKMADVLENIDFEKVGEKAQSAATRAYRTVGDMATDAARNVENAWNEVKETREAPGGIGDYKISGSSTIDGGCYNRIIASGSCKVSSDLVCREMRVSGSFRACGGVDCNGAVRTTGSLNVAGKLIAGSLNSSGSTKIQGDLESGPVTSTGGLTVGGNVKATAVRSSGGLHVAGDVEADSFHTTGGLDIGGMVNADQVDIQLAVGQSNVGSVGGSSVKIYQSASAGLLSNLGVAGTLSCESVEGDDVDLTAVKAQVVRGGVVVIRSGCDIEQVEYTQTCTIDGDAHVGACVKV